MSKEYEQARDEAAEKYAIYEYGEILGLASKLALKDFKAGADWHRSYADEKYSAATSRNVELDVENLELKQKLANSIPREDVEGLVKALEFYSDEGKWMIVRDFVGDQELEGLELFEVEYSKAAKALADFKAKHGSPS